MTIDEACQKLREHLGDDEVFIVTHDGSSIKVTVNFIYRLSEVTDLQGTWEGYPVNPPGNRGRVSCW